VRIDRTRQLGQPAVPFEDVEEGTEIGLHEPPVAAGGLRWRTPPERVAFVETPPVYCRRMRARISHRSASAPPR
jgi:hypothetical protein